VTAKLILAIKMAMQKRKSIKEAIELVSVL
jgi:hypothetical protein